MTNTLEKARIGIDIGRVVLCPTDDMKGPDTSFLTSSTELAMKIPPAPGAERTIQTLVQRTGGQVWYVSKAGSRIQNLTKEWFRRNSFHEKTRVPPERLLFCIKRHEKRGIAKLLRLTHFIDDRLDVLEPMRGVVPRLYLFGVQQRPAPDWVISVRNWHELEVLLLGSNGKGDVTSGHVVGQPNAVL
jgi:hypothetical protein